MLKKIIGTGITAFVILILLVIGPISFTDPMASLQSTNAYGYGGGGGGGGRSFYSIFGNTVITPTTPVTPTNPIVTTPTAPTNPVAVTTEIEETTGSEGAPTEGLGGITGATTAEESTSKGGGITGAVTGTSSEERSINIFLAIGHFFSSIGSWFVSLFA